MGTFLALLSLVLLGAGVAADGGSTGDIKPTIVVVTLLTLPLMGLMVLTIVAVPEIIGRPYRFEPMAFHIGNVLTLAFMLIFFDALVGPYAHVEGVDPTLSFSVVGVMSLLFATAVFHRYLLLPVPWATVAGGAIAIHTVSRVYWAVTVPTATLYQVEDLFRLSLPFTALLFVGLLLMETTRYHLLRDDGHREPEGPSVPQGRRMLRLGEAIIINFALAVGVALAWL